jgi:glucose-6-phosphate dehydrogenase assembly protein OpcA
MAVPATVPSAPVALRDVEKELVRQMRQAHGPGPGPIQQARMSNLIVFCDTVDQALQVEAGLQDIVATHPCRVLLLIGEAGPTSLEVLASVKVRPIPLSGNRYAYCEQITLAGSGGMVDRLPSVVRSLLVGDLPVNLWWAAPVPPPLAGPLLADLAEHCQQIIYDSLGWPDPARGVAATAAWLERLAQPGGPWRAAADLNWRRLKGWRRLHEQALDPASAPGAVESLGEIVMEHGPHGMVQAWLLASWLVRVLRWRVDGGKAQSGSETLWRCQKPNGAASLRIRRLQTGPPAVQRVRLACVLTDQPAALNLSAESEQRLAITPEGVPGVPRTLTVAPQSPAELVGRQLSDRSRDEVFTASMAVAQVMALSVLG